MYFNSFQTTIQAVIGDLENSYEVSDDREGPEYLYRNKQTWGECNTTELFTITSKMALQQDSSQNPFAPDVRAFGLLVLEMLVALSQHQQKMRLTPRSRVSRLLEDVAVDVNLPVETSTPHDCRLYEGESSSSRVPAMYDASGERMNWSSQEAEVQDLHPVVAVGDVSREPHHTGDFNSGQQEHENSDLYPSCGHVRGDAENYRRCHVCVDSAGSQHEDSLCLSCQSEDISSRDSVDLNRPHPETPPKLSVRAFTADRNSNLTVVKTPLQLQTKPRDHVIKLPEIGESDTESAASIYRPYARRGSYSGKQILTNGSLLTPRTTPELRTPTSRADSAANTPTSLSLSVVPFDDDAITDSSEQKHTTPTVSRDNEYYQDTSFATKIQETGFQTIYEEDENQSGTLPKKSKPQIPPKPRRLLKAPVPVKRRPPPPLPRGENYSTVGKNEATGKKRLSMASLDESVISAADSGLGSSHYEGSYCGSEISSIYQPGSRSTIYSGSMTEGSELYCAVKPALVDRKSTSKPMDSGIDSSVDSCDELGDKFVRHLEPQEYDLSAATSESSCHNTKGHDSNDHSEESVDNTYEQLPDIPDSPAVQPRRKEKQPCVGHHEHLSKDHSPCRHKPHSSSPPRKASVTISTQTTDSLERPKNEKPTAPESVADAEWRTLVNQANKTEEPELESHMNTTSASPRKHVSFTTSLPHGQSIRHHAVRQKTVVHQETVHSQPVHPQPVSYPQKLQALPSPPRQIYTQASAHQKDWQTAASSEPRNVYLGQTHETRIRDQKSNGDASLQYDSQKQLPLAEVEIPLNAQKSALGQSYLHHWSDHKHNLAYYKTDSNHLSAPVMREGFAVRQRLSTDGKYPGFESELPADFGARRHETDEEKMSHALTRLSSEGKLGNVAGKVSVFFFLLFIFALPLVLRQKDCPPHAHLSNNFSSTNNWCVVVSRRRFISSL